METRPQLTEEELVERAQKGDHQALSQLVINYRSRIYHLGLRLTGSEQDAEDILQEAFLIMVKKIHQFQGNSSFYTWLYRIAVNIGLRKLKSKPHKYQHVSIDDPDIEYISSVETAEWPTFDFNQINQKQFRKKLDQLVEKLPDIYRTVFILRDLHELSTEDTSNILQITPSNTKIRLMRARNFLKEELEKLVDKEGLI
ncbi:MAG: sigma-70 family RNA polymerase sigma factor [Candidatus Marinimicrobia bacterium]|nr:sigma-70 family RNA polymerase sigma factor [Candidatus Neomarinimicrobiota bacterium]